MPDFFPVEVTSDPYFPPGLHGPTWFTLEVVSEPVPELVETPFSQTVHATVSGESQPPAQQEIQVGDGHLVAGGGSALPISAGVEYRQKIPSRVEIKFERFVASISGSGSASRLVSLALPGRTSAQRSVEFVLPGARGQAENLMALLADDEDALLALLL